MLKKWKSNKKSRTTKLYHSDRTIHECNIHSKMLVCTKIFERFFWFEKLLSQRDSNPEKAKILHSYGPQMLYPLVHEGLC